MNAKLSRLRGTITAKNFSTSSKSIDLTVRDTRNRLLSVQHRYPSTDVLLNVHSSLEKGMAIECYIEGSFDPLKVLYAGVGVITVLDPLELSPDWEDVDEDLFPAEDPSVENWEFGADDIQRIRALLGRAKAKIQEEFSPTPETMQEVEQRLDRLARKARNTTVFDWKRLFVTAIVGVAADLGFGGSVPEALISLFKAVFTEFIQHRLLLASGDQEDD